MSVLQRFYDLASTKNLAFFVQARATEELPMLMIAVQLLRASVRHHDADVMVCRDANIIGGVTLHLNFVNWHLS